jgi:REP element-mobilizing transposase RayT
MGRSLRMLVSDQKTAYHVISRTALLGLPFDDADKDMFVKILRKYASIYFADVLGFCFMSNHFHLVLQMHPEDYCSDKDIKNRFKMYYGKDQVFPEEKLSYFRKRWSNLSELVGEIKQTFSRYFNKKHSRKGTLWAERYKSVIVENG